LLVHGGVGIFNGRVPLAWPGGIYQFNGTLTGGYAVTGAALNRIRFRADPYHQWQAAETGAAPNKDPVNLVAENFRMPSLLRGSLALENDFTNGWKLSIEAMYSKNLSSISYTNINLLPPTDHVAGPDNRPVYSAVNNGKIPLTGNGSNPFDYIILLGNRAEQCGYAWEIGASLRKLVAEGTVLELSHHYGKSYVLTDGTSSINSSQWRTVETVNGRNDPGLSVSDFSAAHKFNLWLSSRIVKARTGITVSLAYTGQSGQPFSYVYQNSITRDDGRAGSYDLVYIPTSTELNAMAFLPAAVRGLIFSPQQQQEALEDFIRSTPYLSARRGMYAERNGSRTPFTHTVNMKLATRQQAEDQ
jgi:hypothetical protein